MPERKWPDAAARGAGMMRAGSIPAVADISDPSIARLFVCYTACRLHPGFVHSDVVDIDYVDSNLEDTLRKLIMESVGRRKELPTLIADRLEGIIALSRAEILKIAAAACTYLDNLQLNDYIDGICSHEYVSIRLACEVLQEISAQSWYGWRKG